MRGSPADIKQAVTRLEAETKEFAAIVRKADMSPLSSIMAEACLAIPKQLEATSKVAIVCTNILYVQDAVSAQVKQAKSVISDIVTLNDNSTSRAYVTGRALAKALSDLQRSADERKERNLISTYDTRSEQAVGNDMKVISKLLAQQSAIASCMAITSSDPAKTAALLECATKFETAPAELNKAALRHVHHNDITVGH